MGVPVDGTGRIAEKWLLELSIGVRGVAARVEFVVAIQASVATDEGWHHDAIPDADVGDLVADLENFTHELVAEDVTLAHAGQISVDEVQIRSAGRGESNLNDHVVRVDEARIIDRLDG